MEIIDLGGNPRIYDIHGFIQLFPYNSWRELVFPFKSAASPMALLGTYRNPGLSVVENALESLREIVHNFHYTLLEKHRLWPLYKSSLSVLTY